MHVKTLHLTFLTFTMLLFIACTNNNKPKANSQIPPHFIEHEPVFTHHGNLHFLNNNDTITSINIEIAETTAAREKGLMFRKKMLPTQGMLFIFDTEQRNTFWMKNTEIPLDIIFVNSNLKIIDIVPNCKPYSLAPIQSIDYSQFVVEVVAGFCKQNNISIGNNISFNKI